MRLFKNKVGRPSNETISKRRKIYALVFIATSCLICFLVVFLVNQFNTDVSSKTKNALGTERKAYFVTGSKTVIKPCTSLLSSCKIIVPTPNNVDSHYTFLGFSKKRDSKTVDVKSGTELKHTQKEVRYYAVIQYTHKITFYSNYATNSSNYILKTFTCTKYTTSNISPCEATAPTVKPKSGFTFEGWTSSPNGSTEYRNNNISYSGTKKLYARTISTWVFKARFYSNDGKRLIGSNSCWRYNGASTCKVSLENRADFNNYIAEMKKKGYTFKGWASEKNVKYTQTNKYSSGYSVSINRDGVNKYAVFK